MLMREARGVLGFGDFVMLCMSIHILTGLARVYSVQAFGGVK